MTSRYYDGKIATPHLASVSVSPHFVTIAAPTLDKRLQWQMEDVVIHQYPKGQAPAIIGNRREPDARLYIEVPAVFDQIEAAAPKSRFHRLHLHSSASIVLACFAAALIAVIILYYSVARVSEWVATWIPESWEHSLGESVVASMVENHPLCGGAEGKAVLDSVVQRLLSQEPQAPAITLLVVDDPTSVNAFAAPGGFVVVYSGLIHSAETPDEVTGVIAHEIGHVIHRHPSEGLVRSIGIFLFFQVAFGGGDSQTFATIAQQLTTMSYSRDAEREADDAATVMLNRASISPAGLKAFFDRMEAEGHGGEMLSYFSTHPPMKERSKALDAAIYDAPYQPSMSASQWQAVQSMCAL